MNAILRPQLKFFLSVSYTLSHLAPEGRSKFRIRTSVNSTVMQLFSSVRSYEGKRPVLLDRLLLFKVRRARVIKYKPLEIY